jgi:hypothetical protein
VSNQKIIIAISASHSFQFFFFENEGISAVVEYTACKRVAIPTSKSHQSTIFAHSCCGSSGRWKVVQPMHRDWAQIAASRIHQFLSSPFAQNQPLVFQ